jgi:RNA polymerase sigma-70 factor (ECF subfamily)
MDFELPETACNEARSAWYRYFEQVMAFRPRLHRYCRRLTQDPWDAEDLIQDTFLRGFGKLGSVNHRIDNPRAYLLRIATNIWIDTQRRRATELSAMRAKASQGSPVDIHATSPADADEVRSAAIALLQRLSPQERACLVLKDVFEMDLQETASVLGTTVGAVKAALHRGRGRLDEADATTRSDRPLPSAQVIDQFVDRYNARDLPGLLALMLDTASIDLLGLDLEIGRSTFERERGWFHHNLNGPPGWPAGQPFPARWQRASFRGEPVALVFNPDREGREVLSSVMRFEECEGRIAGVRVYAMCPETVHEVGEELGYPTTADPYALVAFILSLARQH